MARTLIFHRLSLGFVILFLSISIAFAQPNTTPGLPWTYVTPDSLPVGAVDTAFEYSLFRPGQDSTSEIRWVYRVNSHLQLTEITDSNTFFIEVPRQPGSFGLTETVEMIEMEGPFVDLFESETLISRILSGQGSRSHPEYFFPSFELEENIRLSQAGDTIETTYFGAVVRIPQRNFIIENPNDTAFRSYTYFLQYVDSIWFPQISSVETPREARSFNTFPNPTTSVFSIELPAQKSIRESGYIMRIYDPAAKLIDTRKVRQQGTLYQTELPVDGPPGIYTITLYDERGVLAVGRVMKR